MRDIAAQELRDRERADALAELDEIGRATMRRPQAIRRATLAGVPQAEIARRLHVSRQTVAIAQGRVPPSKQRDD